MNLNTNNAHKHSTASPSPASVSSSSSLSSLGLLPVAPPSSLLSRAHDSSATPTMPPRALPAAVVRTVSSSSSSSSMLSPFAPLSPPKPPPPPYRRRVSGASPHTVDIRASAAAGVNGGGDHGEDVFSSSHGAPHNGSDGEIAKKEKQVSEAAAAVAAEGTPREEGGAEWTPSDEVWFADGSVVLVCAARVGFRVHAGVLGVHSDVLRELCDGANTSVASANNKNKNKTKLAREKDRSQEKEKLQEEDGEEDGEGGEVHDGCPVVRLPDAPDDMALFLRAMYDRTCVSSSLSVYPDSRPTPTSDAPSTDPDDDRNGNDNDNADDDDDVDDVDGSRFLQDPCVHSLFALGAVLAIATTYGARGLRRELARTVCALYPASRRAYRLTLYPDSPPSRFSSSSISPSSPSSSGPLVSLPTHGRRRPTDAHPLLALEIARRCRLPSALPAAALGALRAPLADVLDGFRLADGRWVKVDKGTARCCLVFRERMGDVVEGAVGTEEVRARLGEGSCASTGAKGVVGSAKKDEGEDTGDNKEGPRVPECVGVTPTLARSLETYVRSRGCATRVVGSVLELQHIPISSASTISSTLDRTLGALCTGCRRRVGEWEEEVQARTWDAVPGALGLSVASNNGTGAGVWAGLRAREAAAVMGVDEDVDGDVSSTRHGGWLTC